MNTIISAWCDRLISRPPVLMPFEERFCHDLVLRSAYNDGRNGIGLCGHSTPAYPENLYFFSNIISCILPGALNDELPRLTNIKNNLIAHIDHFFDGAHGYRETSSFEYEPFTSYYFHAARIMLLGEHDKITDAERRNATQMADYVLQRKCKMFSDINILFWVAAVCKWCGCDKRLNEALAEQVSTYKSESGGFSGIQGKGIPASIPATGKALLVLKFADITQENESALQFLAACNKKGVINEVIGSGPTWDALKWGAVINYVAGGYNLIKIPDISESYDAWKIHATIVARQCET